MKTGDRSGGLVKYIVSSPPDATEEIGAKGREIESHQSIGRKKSKNGNPKEPIENVINPEGHCM
jgi:hypothetical protein